MKTKLKKNFYSSKKNILQSKNFLNSQNYILGKKEKKKLLNKFFIEQKLLLFLNFSLGLEQVIVNRIIEVMTGSLFIGPIIIGMIFYYFFYSDYLFKNFYLFIGTFVFSSISFLITILILYFYDRKKLYKLENFNFSKYYFLQEKPNLLWYTFLIGSFFAVFFLLFFGLLEKDINLFFALLVVIGFIIFLFISKIFFRLKLINILFLPIYLVLAFFQLIFGFFYTFILKGIKSYKFIKFFPQTKFFKKFEILKKNFAKNKYYLIKRK